MAIILEDKRLVDKWSMVIEHGAGKQDYLLEKIQSYLEQADLPNVSWQEVIIAQGMWQSLFGRGREYLLVTNSSLRDWRMYIGFMEYGANSLDVTWFLTVEPGPFRKLFSKLLTKDEDDAALSFALNFSQEQYLRLFITSVHRFCVKRAVEELLEEIKQDVPKFAWESKGFLKIW